MGSRGGSLALRIVEPETVAADSDDVTLLVRPGMAAAQTAQEGINRLFRHA